MASIFDHEKLNVYQESIKFIIWLQQVMKEIPKGVAAYGQLDKASTSIPLNIAEGNGKYTSKDRCRFFDIARGSSLDCAAALDVLVAKNILQSKEIEPGKRLLINVVSMLVGLIKSNSEDRVCEPTTEYGLD